MNEKEEKLKRREKRKKQAIRLGELADVCAKCPLVPTLENRSSQQLAVCKGCEIRIESDSIQRTWGNSKYKHDDKLARKQLVGDLIKQGKKTNTIANRVGVTISAINKYKREIEKEKEDTVQQIFLLLDQGLSKPEVAEKLGLTYNFVAYHVSKRKDEFKNVDIKEKSKVLREKIVELKAQGMTFSDIGKELGIHRTTVFYHLRKQKEADTCEKE